MKIAEIVKHLVQKEAGKSEVKVADVREIVGIISDLVYSNAEALSSLIANGNRRSKKKR